MSKRAKSVANVLDYKPDVYGFQGNWRKSIGQPERGCSIAIWGDSGNGKTTFAFQLCKYLATFDRFYYNSLEEGLSKTIQDTYTLLNMAEVNGRFILGDKEPMDEMTDRLSRKNSPNAYAIDSVQYSNLTYEDYKALREKFPRKTIITISHADGKMPAGATAKSIMYNADVKIRVDGFRAFIRTRFGGGRPYDIWPEEAERIHGEIEDL